MIGPDVNTWSMTMLSKEGDYALAKLRELEGRAAPDDAAAKLELTNERTKATRWFKKINDELVRREAEIEKKKQDKEDEEREERRQERLIKKEHSDKQVATNGGATSAELNMRAQAIKEAVNGLSKFEAGVEPATFVRNVKNIAGQAESDAEKSFMLKLLFNRLSPEYQTAYRNHEQTSAITTIEELCAYVSKQYESKKALSQYFQELYEIGRRDNENVRNFAARVEEKIFDSKTVIKSKFLDLKKKENPDFDGKIEVDDVFALMGVENVLRSLKSNKNCYNYTITRSDECFTAAEVANVAEAFTERRQQESNFMNSHESVNYGRDASRPQQTDLKKTECFFWTGRRLSKGDKGCTKGDKCERKHDPAMKDKLRKKSDETKNDTANTRGDGGNRGNGGAGAGNVNHARTNADTASHARGGAVFQ